MADNPAAKAFAHALRRLMEQRGESVRGLGKRVDGDDPERGRRRVQRHLSGKHLPTRSSRDGYADALEVDVSELPLPDDETDDSVEAIVREARSLSRKASGLAMRLEAMGVRA